MELSKHYNPAAIEDKWYKHWLEKRYFHSEPDERVPFTVVIPPPNVTGVLHMGHTLNETVQDILVRRARMRGYNACWVPGSDHASIATEARVVAMLKERGIEKSQLSRDEFLNYAYEWKDKYGSIIYNQIAKLGCSVDWDRVAFTMDPGYYKAVIKVFVDLYKKGLIYRGARMINWDPAAKTALSDEEVEYREVEGKLYYVKYLIADENSNQASKSGEYITIATQRPETIMGDTGVCVNPGDERYQHLRGKFAIVPLVNRKVPIIFDEYVDKEFGTGALKVTPAHDINDYNLGLKYGLPVIDTLNEDGTLSAAAEVFVGEDRFVARKLVVEALEHERLLLKEENYITRLGYSQRSHAVVEPRISTQWFVRMKELASPALNTVLEGEVQIYPAEKFLATYKYWLENVKDWCISRQLWWGQRIPAWYDAEGNLFVAETVEEALQSAQHSASGHSRKIKIEDLHQDEDVLDTWFSSWLWPMEVFKGITQPGNPDIQYYYPTSVLVTGQDIIFFWVARMIMAGMEYMHKKPFSDVYFTGMVRDKLGRKMSKSLGNSPDLLQLIDKYGADAVRFGILISSPAGNDLLFDEASLEQGRNFNNKLWNALKLVRSWKPRVDEQLPEKKEFAVEWFENKLNETRELLERYFKDYKLSEALKNTYSLIWDDFCSWYLEWVKPGYHEAVHPVTYQKTIQYFEDLMQVLHPVMPFITEEIYHLLSTRVESDDLCIRPFKKIEPSHPAILKEGEFLKAVITEIRNTKAKMGLGEFSVHFPDQRHQHLAEIIKKNTKASHVFCNAVSFEGMISLVVGDERVFIEAEKAVDSQFQKDELLKEIEYHRGFLVAVNKKLTNEKFIRNAKPEVIALEQKKKADAEAKIKALEESLMML
ncbi:MAG: valine--tRNA ligase [Bacteroidetes bacterium]|nr:MAG: valine--tRNA ligase [Bacteroidota bacterium]